MDKIPTSPYKIPRNAYQRELAAIDPAMYLPIPPTLRPLMPILKALLQRTATEPEKTAPASETKPVPESPYMDFDEACAYLRITERQLKDLCRDQRSRFTTELGMDCMAEFRA